MGTFSCDTDKRQTLHQQVVETAEIVKLITKCGPSGKSTLQDWRSPGEEEGI